MSCPGGRWGPRRVRVTEWMAVVRAEDLYTTLHEDKSGAKDWVPGSRERPSSTSMTETSPLRGKFGPTRSGGAVGCFLPARDAESAAHGCTSRSRICRWLAAGAGGSLIRPGHG